MPPRELTMPKLSDSMADAVILRWLKSAGEDFAAEWDGTLDSILVQEGSTVAVGEPIATLADGDGAVGKEAPPAHSQSERVAPPPAPLPAAEPRPAADDSAPGRPVATPVARA